MFVLPFQDTSISERDVEHIHWQQRRHQLSHDGNVKVEMQIFVWPQGE